jgi:hypothetical protein
MNCNPAGQVRRYKRGRTVHQHHVSEQRIAIETPEMDIPAGVVQYPKAEDTVAGQPVSYSLLMSFNDIEERADLRRHSRSSWTRFSREYWTWLYRGRRNSSRR